MRKTFIFGMGLIIAFQNLFAQQNTLPINLEKVLRMGGANNLTIQQYKKKQDIALAELAESREWWLPDFYAGLRTNQLCGASMNSNGRFFLDVTAANLWGGMGLNANWDPGTAIYMVKSNKLKVQSAHFESIAERNKSLLDLIDVYFEFLKSQLNYKAYERLAEQSEIISQQIEIQVQSGLRFNSEALLAKSELNHLKIEMLRSKMNYLNRSAEMLALLDLDPSIQLISTDSTIVPIDLNPPNQRGIDPDSSFLLRPEYRQISLNKEALIQERKTQTVGLFIPDFGFNTYGSYYGGLFSPVEPMQPLQYPETQTLYPTGSFNVYLMWRIPLGRIFYAGKLKKYNDQIMLKDLKLRETKNLVNKEIKTSKQTISNAREQMEIAKEGKGFAQAALEQSIQRQEIGTVRPFEILQAQEIFIRSQLDFIEAVSSYNTAQFRLKVALGENL